MNETNNISAQATYFEANTFNFSKPIYPGFRCSIWLDESDFTAAEWINIDKGIMLPGEVCIITMNLLPTSLLQRINIGTNLYWGVPYNCIGSCRIIST